MGINQARFRGERLDRRIHDLFRKRGLSLNIGRDGCPTCRWRSPSLWSGAGYLKAAVIPLEVPLSLALSKNRKHHSDHVSADSFPVVRTGVLHVVTFSPDLD